MKNIPILFRAMSREERIAHAVFAISALAGALEFHAFMPKKNLKDSKASALTYFYGSCIGYSVGIFASGVAQIPIRGVAALSAASIAHRIYLNQSKSGFRG